MTPSLREMAVEVLTTADAHAKVALSRAHAARWFAARGAGTPLPLGKATPPDRPARPAKPELLAPRDVPQRKPGTETGRAAMLHAIAHIELNAVDLHWDIIARFPDVSFPLGFYDDWVKSADEESKHFKLLTDRLEAYGTHYGALSAHAGMWQSAEVTAQDILGRLAVVPMVLEARGLDVTPGMIKLFQQAKDHDSVAALEVIYSEEVAHVAYGSKWFHFLCGRDNRDPKETFHDLVRKYFPPKLKPPFNTEKRAEAGIAPDFYWPLTEEGLPIPAALA
ncbi:MAG: ferritin-like domain-containing protein [Pseudomonadota bacterium]